MIKFLEISLSEMVKMRLNLALLLEVPVHEDLLSKLFRLKIREKVDSPFSLSTNSVVTLGIFRDLTSISFLFLTNI